MHLLQYRGTAGGVAVIAVLMMGISSCGGGGGGPPNPVLGTTSFTTIENIALNGTLTATDGSGGAITFAQTGNPKSGTVTGFTAAGAFVYTPTANFTGSDSFTIKAADAAGGSTTGMVTINVSADTAPTATSTIVSAKSAADPALTSINVLANASYPVANKLTVAITAQPASGLGTASVNSDGSVSLIGVPGGFKGLISFEYSITDPSGKTPSNPLGAAVFVGVAPFRAAFVADTAAKNGSYEVYLTDFTVPPTTPVTQATQGTVHLQGFAVSDNGATVVYRSQDSSNPAAASSIYFVQTAKPATQTQISLPAAPVLDANGKDQFLVSPDGNWIALILGSSVSSSALYLVNITSPTVVKVAPTGSIAAMQPKFTSDSKSIYFLGGVTSTSGTQPTYSLYVSSLSSLSTAPTLVSAASNPATNDEVSAYSVAPNQSSIVEQATRNGGVGLFYINPKVLTVENALATLGPGQAVTSSTVGLPAGMGGSSDGTIVAYTIQNPPSNPTPNEIAGIYTASVSITPNQTLVGPAGNQIIGLRPDNKALLYTDTINVFEDTFGAGIAGVQLGAGSNASNAVYDSSGNIVLLEKSAGANALTLTTTNRPFSTNSSISPSAADVDVSGFDRAVVIFGPSSGSTTTTLEIVNALVPGVSIGVAPEVSPIQLTSYVSKVTD